MNPVSSAPLLFFPNLQAGMNYLSRLPLADPPAAAKQLGQFLDVLMAAPPDHVDLLVLLERARAPMASVHEEMARRYHNKPLVLGEAEERTFQQVASGWRKMGKAYALCAQRGQPGAAGGGDAQRLATILHRCLYYTGMIILEHYRTRRELPSGIWLELHRYYETAEDWGVALVPVEDGLNRESPSSHCTAAYVACLLVEMASPYSHSVRDINLIRRWAGLWSPLVAVQRTGGDAVSPPYGVDLMKDAGLQPVDKDRVLGRDLRQLDTSLLTQEIDQALLRLREKILPSQLRLGEENAAHVAKLLGQLQRPWGQSAATRKFRRFATSGKARVCVGFEAMHFRISGAEFEQPEAARVYSRSEFDTLFTFRHSSDPGRRPAIRSQNDFPVDDWEVINHSANGFRLARSSVGQKMSHGQLLAVCPHDGDKFLLAHVCWLMQERDGGLIAGVALLPGMPVGIALRPAEAVKEANPQFVRAFLLSPVPTVAEKGSVVIPAGLYRASRILEVHSGGYWRICLKTILQRGTDFDRVSFETV